MTANLLWISSLAICCTVCCGCSLGLEERTWVSITENGDKPGTALVLTEKSGRVTDGKFYILDPNHPRDLSKGKGYDLSNLTHENGTIKCDLSVIDESSKTKTKDLRLTITLKEVFKGDKVQAELQEGDAKKQPILFERNDRGMF